MNFGLLNIVYLIGALTLFIYGMKFMSESIQKVAGLKMRRILGRMTSVRLLGVLSGTFLTALLQSSTAVSVMVVSFVNAGLLSLTESIGVILGANLGTTITAWLVAGLGLGEFSVSALSLPFLALALPLVFMPYEKLRHWGETFIGFGMVLLGLSFMRESLPDLRENPNILEFVQYFEYYGLEWWGQLGTLALFVLIGFVMTLLLQSSSAAMALTLVLTAQGWISFPLAAAIVMGENIGTTITANIAALVANVHAKRAARAHLIYNLLGILWLGLSFPYFLRGVSWFSTQYLQGDPRTSGDAIPMALAFFHTSFNLINLLLFIGLTGVLARIATRWVPSRGEEDEVFSLDYMGSGVLATSELSLVEARKQLAKMADLMRRAYKLIPTLIIEMEESKLQRHARKLQKYEDISDRMEIEISEYLGKVSEGELSSEGIQKVKAMLHVAHYLERMGDIYLEVSRNLTRRKEQKAYFTPEMRNNVLELSEWVQQSLDQMVKNVDNSDETFELEGALELEQEIDELYQKMRRHYLDRLQKGKYRLQSGMYYSDLLAEMERIGDHATSISKTLAGQGPTEQR